jgi:two-component system sensor histidine kinase DegS
LFRIVQEALSNVQKHAKAEQVSVQLVIRRDALTAIIKDDGVGFDLDALSRDPEKWDHFGVRGIIERARLVGGEATIDSKKGAGTRIAIEVPLVRGKEATHDGAH